MRDTRCNEYTSMRHTRYEYHNIYSNSSGLQFRQRERPNTVTLSYFSILVALSTPKNHKQHSAMLKHHHHQQRPLSSSAAAAAAHRSILLMTLLGWTFLASTTTMTTMTHAQSLGIPGTTQTISGYDTEFGTDAICWSSWQAASENRTTHADHAIDLPNPLIEGFHIDAAGVTLLRACPAGNTLQGTAPAEFRAGERLRTGVWYNYTVKAQLNLTALGGTTVVADNGTFVSIQILLCVLGASGFCHPFVHEESNERLIRDDGVLEDVPVGDRHGQSHVHSPYYMVELDTTTTAHQQHHQQQDLATVYNIEAQVPMLVNQQGDFFAVTAVQLYVPKEEEENGSNTTTTTTTTAAATTTTLWRYDMANALEQRVLSYQDPATILQVPDGIKYFSYCAIAVVASVILFLFYQTYKHVNHQVLQLTQGYFLLVFLWAALVATVSSFLVEPKNDAYCQAENFILLIHMQLMYAIIVGRLWRIHTVISPLLVQTLKQREGSGGVMLLRMRRWLGLRGSAAGDGADSINAASSSSSPSSSGPLFRGSSRGSRLFGSSSHAIRRRRRRSSSMNRSKQIRKQVTAWQLLMVIALFTLPQMVLQILSLALQPMEQTLDMNEDESKGRVICSDDVSLGASLNFYGYLCFCCLILVLLFMAYSTRSLPSLFNETRVIFDSTVTTLVLLVVGMGIILATDSPTTSPAVRYIVKIGIVLSTTLNTTTRIMMPKLRLVWSGEKVIVSQLVSDHNKALRRQGSSFSSSDGKHASTPAVYDPNSLRAPGEAKQQPQRERMTSNTSSARSNSQQILDEMDDFVNGVSENDNAKQSLDEQDDIAAGDDYPVETKQRDVEKSRATVALLDEEAAALRQQQQRQQPHNESTDLLPPEPSLKNVNFQSAARQSTVRFVDSLDNNVTTATRRYSHQHQQHHQHHAVVIKQDEAPSRRLILKMLNLQEQLSRVNERIIFGMAVPENDWESVRRLNRKLATAFSEDVEFEWEQQLDDEEGNDSSEIIQTVSA